MCGFDIGCHIHTVIDPVWFWIFWGFWAVMAALALWGLSKVKDIAGWPGVAAVAGALIYGFGYFRGRSGGSINPLEQVDETSPDARPPHSRPKRQVVPRRPTKPSKWPDPPKSLSSD